MPKAIVDDGGGHDADVGAKAGMPRAGGAELAMEHAGGTELVVERAGGRRGWRR